MWKVTVATCIVASLATLAVFRKALFEPNPDPWLEEFRAQPGWWCAAVAPYLGFAGLAYAYRRRLVVSLIVFVVNLALIFLALTGWYEGLQPVGPNAPPFPRGLGPEMAPIVQLVVFVMLAVAVAGLDAINHWWTRRSMKQTERVSQT